MKFAVFASGHGTNLQAIIDAVKVDDIKAELALVFSDKRKAHALVRAGELDLVESCHELAEHHAQFEPSQLRAQTEVLSDAESHMRIRSAIDPKDPINHAQGRALPAWQAWSDSQIRVLNQIAGPLMTRYGYGLEAEWQERVERAG